MSSKPVVVVELPLFIRQEQTVWDEAGRNEFLDYIAGNPEVGDIIPETGGVRKVRWRRPVTGKRGDARVVYVFNDVAMPLFLILVYAKAQRENMTPIEKKQVKELAMVIRRQYGR